MADPQNRPVEAREQIRKLQLEVPLEVAVERGERLVEQDGARLRGEDAGEGDALRLSAGELRGIALLQPLEPEAAQLLRRGLLLFRARAGADAAEDVLLHRHVREEGVLLEQVPHAAALGREVDAALAVKKRLAVEDDAAAVGRHDARDALERHALAAAGRAEQRRRPVFGFELHAQRERVQPLFDVHKQAHAALLLPRLAAVSRFFRSSMFTTSRMTAEMPTLTSTHFSASSSLLSCQSW